MWAAVIVAVVVLGLVVWDIRHHFPEHRPERWR